LNNGRIPNLGKSDNLQLRKYIKYISVTYSVHITTVYFHLHLIINKIW